MSEIHRILKEYWGHEEFRPPQQQIIESVLEGKDVLGLLPTGGGKSICFQLPALVLEGVCIVISPLIALMKDQVENLQKRGIRASAIFSGMHPAEITATLENCLYGGVKFLYISPERLTTERIKAYLTGMKVALIAVDEAHCISQWGHDFRPEYRKIANLRELLPGIPVMALTASATPDVALDIQQQLGFKKTCVFQKSFERKNLNYIVRVTETKSEKLIQSLKAVSGSGLVYVRNRRKTQEFAKFLIKNGIQADYYHAGLGSEERARKQEDWIKGRLRIMVCTNAFGMGIDKPDCQVVIHLEIPDCMEAYYQEAGRAGRDGNKAYCMLLYHPSDAISARKRLEQNFPERQMLIHIYESLCNYLKIPVGGITEAGIEIDPAAFVASCGLNPALVYASLKLLSQSEIIQISEGFNQSATIQTLASKNEFDQIEKSNPLWFEILQTILRNYGGSFDAPVPVNESVIAGKINLSENELKFQLSKMNLMGVIAYYPQTDKPLVLLNGPRVEGRYLSVNMKLIRQRKESLGKMLESVIAYSENTRFCRSRVILNYFGETDSSDCGTCDVCRSKGINKINGIEAIMKRISGLNWSKPKDITELVSELPDLDPEYVVMACRYLTDKSILQLDSQQRLYWKGKG